ncbi:tachylectin-related carbohydrate-binding protein [Streptomyces sp. NPDC001941]|uniref:tachylectin-related carbohydrate-binding protein n=1 Tax=Streptomyces sp. NPDC001941 TaxID=3154659 RepID=UPI003323DEB1
MTKFQPRRPRAARLRTAVAVTAALLPAGLVALPGTAQAAVSLTCTTTGPTYALDSAGKLLRLDMPTPATGGNLPAGSTIDTGWTGYGRILAGPSAAFYGIKSDGLYYSHRISSSATWDVHHKKISDGFTGFRTGTAADDITIDRSGYIWTLDSNGGIRWNHYNPTANAMDAGSGKIIDMGWNRYDAIYAGDKGVIYGRSATDHKLYRSRYDLTSHRWLERHVLESSADWSDTKSMASYGGDTLVRVKGNGSVVYYRFDETIRDWPVYNKTVAASGYAAYTSVTAAPDACRIPEHTPAVVKQDFEGGTPTVAMQGSSGKLEFAYTDAIGHLVHGRSDPADITSIQWTTISGNEGFSGAPSLSQHSDGRVVVTAQNVTGALWQRNQAAVSSADWGGWIDLSGHMAQHAITAKTPSGLMVQFASDADGKPWYRIQQRANVDFMGWMPLGGSGFTGPFTAVTVRDGIQLFGKNAGGVLQTAQFKEAGTLSAWTALGNQAVTGTPSVVVYPGYRLRVVANDGNGKVLMTAQSDEGGAFGAWNPLGDAAHDPNNPGTPVDPLVAQGSPTAVLSPTTGLLEVVVRATDGTLYNTGETTQGSGTWRSWQKLGTDVAATDPTAFTYTGPSGMTWAYVFRNANNQNIVYQLSTQ